MTRLGNELRRRFPGPNGPRNLLRKLGVDSDLLNQPSMPSSGSHDAPHAMRREIEMMLGDLDLDEAKIEKLLAVLDRHAPHGGERGHDDHHHHGHDDEAGRERVMRHGDEEEDERHEKLRSFLEQRGLDEATIARAVGMVPRNGVQGGIGGMTPANRRDRVSGSDRHRHGAAMDAVSINSFNERFGGEHISIGSPGGMAMDDRRRPRPPTSQQLADFHSRFPDAERLAQ